MEQMTLKQFILEHNRLIKVLKKGTKAEREAEAKEQEEELKEKKKELV